MYIHIRSHLGSRLKLCWPTIVSSCGGMSRSQPGWIWTKVWRTTYIENREGRQWRVELVGLAWDLNSGVVSEKWRWTPIDNEPTGPALPVAHAAAADAADDADMRDAADAPPSAPAARPPIGGGGSE